MNRLRLFYSATRVADSSCGSLIRSCSAPISRSTTGELLARLLQALAVVDGHPLRGTRQHAKERARLWCEQPLQPHAHAAQARETE
jgi:hypothetical protein